MKVPLGASVILKSVIESHEEVVDGVHIPKTAHKNDLPIGEVVAVGDLKEKKVGNGDKIMYQSGTPVTLDGENLVLVSEESLLIKVG